jgi:2'-5' RNA ligase
MRIFISLDIPEDIRQRMERFVDGVRNFAPEARWVRTESLHVTLKFIGEKNLEEVETIRETLSSVQGHSMDIQFGGFGFFPNPRSARVFWAGIESGPGLFELAMQVDEAMASLNIPKEDHPFSPHLTLARAGRESSGNPRQRKGDKPNRHFAKLQEKLATLSPPEFGTMTAREFFLYQSQLGRDGSRYTKIGQFALRSSKPIL